jgi:hypothetical protein
MTVDGLADVKVGDSLILVTGNRYRGDENVTVARIGRQYLYVATNGHEKRERFDRKTGRESGNVGVRARLVTQEQYDESKQRASLYERLRLAGIDVRVDMRTDQLRAILAIVDEKEV